jgi:membrane protein YdbS with pleckstrin-like domain
VLLALVPITLALKTSSLATLAILAVVLSLLIVYEVTRYADVRERVRHQRSPGPGTSP